MATYLALCQRLASESGTLADGQITAVAGQTNRKAKIVRWIADAYGSVQNSRDWNWLQSEFIGHTVDGTQRYAYSAANFTDTIASAVISRWSKWIIGTDPNSSDGGLTLYDSTIGVSDEGPMSFMPWEDFYRLRLRGAASSEEGRPTQFSIDPNGKLVLFPIPDSNNYRLRGRYVKSAQELSADGDTPEMPSRFHDVIVDVALMLLGTHDESGGQIPLWRLRQSQKFNQMEMALLPQMTMAGALA